jgi:uncharacterized protein
MSQPAFLCDEMLGGLARWLRAAGYDTRTAELGSDDGSLVACAIGEGRILLTRDSKMLERRGAWRHVVILYGQSTDAWAEEMRVKLRIAWWHAPFTRCLLCNTSLEPHPAGERLTWCPRCSKLYWPGSHTRRMADCLKRWQGENQPV